MSGHLAVLEGGAKRSAAAVGVLNDGLLNSGPREAAGAPKIFYAPAYSSICCYGSLSLVAFPSITFERDYRINKMKIKKNVGRIEPGCTECDSRNACETN